MHETLVTIALVGVAIYFSVQIVRGAWRYFRFHRLRETAIVTWPGPRPAHFPWQLALGFLAAVVGVLNIYLDYPFHKVYSQLTIAIYFIAVLPLLTRIRWGLYGEGIWGEHGFLPYSRIRRFSFHEGAELVLLLLPRDSQGAVRLHIPAGEYGAVRRVLGDKIRSHVLNLEGSILGL